MIHLKWNFLLMFGEYAEKNIRMTLISRGEEQHNVWYSVLWTW